MPASTSVTLSAEEARQFRELLDKQVIAEVLANWAFSRDQGDWEALAACYHPDAEMIISWYSGPASGFIEGSRTMTDKRKAGEHTKHFLGHSRIRLAGDRALSECEAMVLTRRSVDGIELDGIAFIRFLDRFERRQGVWRIARRVGIYEKDRFDPVAPDEGYAALYRSLELDRHPESCKHLCGVLGRGGRTLNPSIVSGGSDDERAIRSEAEAWLGSAAA